MAGLVVIGFICNALVKAVHARHHMKADDARVTGGGALPGGRVAAART